MRIEQDVRSFYVGVRPGEGAKTPEEVKEGLEKGRVFSGKLQFPQDTIAERRKEAQEKAMNIVKTAFAGERILDASVAEMESSIEKGKEEMVAQKAELNRIAEEKEKLERLEASTGENYETEIAELTKAEEHFSGLIENGKKLEDRTIQALTDIKIERAKSNPMVNATENAEKILEKADEEIVDMLMGEIKEHIDAENEKKQKEAVEKAEKKEELEERIESMKAEKEEEKEDSAPEVDYLEAATRRMVKIAETGEVVQKELKNVVDRLKLDLEDLKGAAVDEGV